MAPKASKKTVVSKTAKPANGKTKPSEAASDKTRVYFKQSDFPLLTLQQAQKIASGLDENFAGKDANPPDLALAIGVSPTSSNWRDLTGAAIAYGLSEGGSNSNVIKMMPLGRKLVAPEEEGQDIAARREAVMKPRIQKEFFEKYRRAKFPTDVIGVNVLKGMGIPPDRAAAALEIVKANGKYAGIIRDTPTGPFVNLDSPGVPSPAVTVDLPEEIDEQGDTEGATGDDSVLPVHQELAARTTAGSATAAAGAANSRKVYISHGKQRAIVSQIKEILEFGSFDPVVSVERESTAVPVPEKVFEDMRSCAAGVIHVAAEGKYFDPTGQEHTKINDNVLIEIGAAMALYGKKIVLLVERGVTLPSNLQGLYRCEYEGDKLDYDSTIKLLKTFNQFK